LKNFRIKEPSGPVFEKKYKIGFKELPTPGIPKTSKNCRVSCKDWQRHGSFLDILIFIKI
jgi:hypothetical protein